MQKPITVTLNEFKLNIMSIINSSGLPFFIMEPVIKDLLGAVHDGAIKQAEKDQAAYDAYLQEKAAGDKTGEGADEAAPKDGGVQEEEPESEKGGE